jgi:hypothetical protein
LRESSSSPTTKPARAAGDASATEVTVGADIGGQGRSIRSADLAPHPPFNPCMRFSRTRLTDDLLDMVTQLSDNG